MKKPILLISLTPTSIGPYPCAAQINDLIAYLNSIQS